jgi:hypothetical protein
LMALGTRTLFTCDEKTSTYPTIVTIQEPSSTTTALCEEETEITASSSLGCNIACHGERCLDTGRQAPASIHIRPSPEAIKRDVISTSTFPRSRFGPPQYTFSDNGPGPNVI